ncbi:MAG TPA: cytochrome ubiquinol oxidase subunit I [Burkholderiales bacterium]|nr:cytochrome ubiquinol oxidase subunit I [Burkholderiales bacterium]
MEEALLLARVQFGLNIGFHILFPAITIGLAWVLVHFRVRYQLTGDPAWLATYKIWVKVFALSFGMGVVSGVVMSFQFGTNWPGFMNTVGNIAGPLLAYEVLTAFFLEATFLGVMLFGMNRVPGWVHVMSAVIVALGTTISAFWILALNSWMHTPAGHMEVNGELIAASWLQVIFNPSFPYRLTHMLLASGITAAFLVAGLSAWRLLHAPHDASAAKTLRYGAHLAAILVPVQIVVGDLHGLNTLKYQPAKVAAMEALWHTERGAPLTLIGIPDETSQANRYAVTIPRALSVILTHSLDGEVLGLAEFGEDVPPVAPVFFAFRVMVGMGLVMLALAWAGSFLLRRQATPRWLLWTFAGFTFSGWVAVIAGWMTTEIGRQPWLVTGILYTRDAVGTATGAQVGASLTAYALTYGVLLVSYMVVLTHLAAKGSR